MTLTSFFSAAADPAHAQAAFVRALHPDSAPHERFLLVQGGPGSGKTRALAEAAAAGRADGLDVVQLRADDGDLAVSSGSLDSLVTLLHGSGPCRLEGHDDGRRAPDRLILIDDFDRLEPAAQARVRAMLIRFAGRVPVACVASVTDRRRVDGWEGLPSLTLDSGIAGRAVGRPTAGQDALRQGRPHDALAVLLRTGASAAGSGERRRARSAALALAGFLGEFAVADRLLGAPEAPVGAAADATASWMRAVRSGELREARRTVLQALQRASAADVDLLVATLQMLCFLRGDGEWWDEALEITGGRDLDPVVRLVEDCLDDGPSAAFDELVEEARGSLAQGEPWKVVSLHVAWSLLDALDPRREQLDDLLAGQREDHSMLGHLLICRRAVAAFQAGRLETAAWELERARAMAVDFGAQTLVAMVDAFEALIHAVRGDRAKASAKADEAARWALRNGAPLVARTADHARSSLDVALGRYEEAYARCMAGRQATSRWIEHGCGPIQLLDAVESAARLRLPGHGLALIQSAEGAIGVHRSPRQTMILTAARAVLDEDGGTRELFETALGTLAATDAPFETARVHLAYGEWLRRGMHALEARLQLRLAATVFESLGAEQWRVRAQHELRAAGGADPGGSPAEGVELSEQERRVASLAAAGLSNKQIAGRLYLSPRTVSGHLYRIFPKLGVTSRAGLRDALIALQQDTAQAG